MLRKCLSCGYELHASNLAESETLGLEADRHAAGLEGLSFRYYLCPECDRAVIFVDVVPLLGETSVELVDRQLDLQRTLCGLSNDDVYVVVAGRSPSRARIERCELASRLRKLSRQMASL